MRALAAIALGSLLGLLGLFLLAPCSPSASVRQLLDRRHQLAARTGGRTRCPSSPSARTRPSPRGRRATEASVTASRVRFGVPVVPPRDREARGQALDVVLERPGERLVEVVHVEQQRPLRRSEHPEVRQVRVPAELHREAGPWRVLQVGGHDLRRAAVEGERRDHHPAVTDRDQVLLARRVLCLEQRDGIGTVRGGLPASMARRVERCAQLLAALLPLLDGRVLDLGRCRHASSPSRVRSRSVGSYIVISRPCAVSAQMTATSIAMTTIPQIG